MGVDRSILDRFERAAGGEKLVAKALQAPRKCGEASLVANRQ
jgi:hypothetical protein